MDLERAKQEFQKYVDIFDTSNKDIHLKMEHSYRVMEISNDIAKRLNLPEEQVQLATLIGLLHDIGRFYQLEQTSSYNDKKLDHSEYGVFYLFEEGHIRDFCQDDSYDEVIQKAVRYHNDFALPDDLTEEEKLFCQIIRDADKIDIFRVDAMYFSRKWNYLDVSLKVLQDFLNHHLINLRDIQSKSDSVICELAFVMDIYFRVSLDILKETHYFSNFVKKIEVQPDSLQKWQELVEICNQVIEGRK